jgi:uncharacterized protein (DUF2141 family)
VVSPAKPLQKVNIEDVRKIEGPQSKEGQILIGINDNSSSFLSDWSKARKLIKLDVSSAQTPSVRVEDLPQGEYGVIIIHDVDRDGPISKN